MDSLLYAELDRITLSCELDLFVSMSGCCRNLMISIIRHLHVLYLSLRTISNNFFRLIAFFPHLELLVLLIFNDKFTRERFSPFSSGFVDDIFVVVISQTPRQLLIVHLGLVFPHAPSPCNLKYNNIYPLDYHCVKTKASPRPDLSA